MLKLREIKTDDAAYPFVENLLIESFPIDERRDIDLQRDNTDNNPVFTLLLAESDGKPAGFITLWNFGEFVYCEHFATAPCFRGRGIGGEIIDQVIDGLEVPLVLEVELPLDEMAGRRIGFYSRHGLRLWDTVDYTQPPYRPSGRQLPMHLMSTAEPTSPDRVIATIHTRVYPLKTTAPATETE